jgi:hypothetical protein
MEHSNIKNNRMTTSIHSSTKHVNNPAPLNPSNGSLYHPTLIQHKVCLPFSEIHDFNNLRGHLMRHVSAQMSGKCIAQGFVKPESCAIRSHSVGMFAGGNISFNLEIECMLCCPEEGTVMQCVAKTVTQAGIRAHACIEPSPVVIYISREMHDSSAQSRMMDSIKPDDTFTMRVIGKRFELNDKHVSIIGELATV